jgi:hypothetical protein
MKAPAGPETIRDKRFFFRAFPLKPGAAASDPSSRRAFKGWVATHDLCKTLSFSATLSPQLSLLKASSPPPSTAVYPCLARYTEPRLEPPLNLRKEIDQDGLDGGHQPADRRGPGRPLVQAGGMWTCERFKQCLNGRSMLNGCFPTAERKEGVIFLYRAACRSRDLFRHGVSNLFGWAG